MDTAHQQRDAGVLACRLCAGPLSPLFSHRILGRHQGTYYRCQACGSLQTQHPYWLEEAYASNNLSSLDTGAAYRNLQNLGVSYYIAKLFGTTNLLDSGGGDGLLCRLLRDYGLNCFVIDKYASVTYAQGFTDPDFARPDMVLAFEVMEHYPNPEQDLDALFAAGAKLVLVSTQTYRGQGEDWVYLAPESGQHVFFYSPKAMALIAERYGYELVACGDLFLFVQPNAHTRLRPAVARLLMRPNVATLLKSRLLLRAAPGVARDHATRLEALRGRV